MKAANLGILTLSDKGSKGERVDESGKVIREMVSGIGFKVARYEVIPDEKDLISRKLIEWADNEHLDLILTTGGTGLAPRDVTPEATLEVVQKLAPGISEAMRAESLKKTPHGMLSRGVSGIRGRTLIINMPGSPKAVRECLGVILPALPHAVETVRGEAFECATSQE
ncbi:MAG: MogA/MoaB family molybdenum cofactor biosynthesis protein [Dehalococcoidia bacterium]|nr:MogA/MoaB family molybdenum cofactor biosynthesis protein [Dehalococcoidia bacterium]